MKILVLGLLLSMQVFADCSVKGLTKEIADEFLRIGKDIQDANELIGALKREKHHLIEIDTGYLPREKALSKAEMDEINKYGCGYQCPNKEKKTFSVLLKKSDFINYIQAHKEKLIERERCLTKK